MSDQLQQAKIYFVNLLTYHAMIKPQLTIRTTEQPYNCFILVSYHQHCIFITPQPRRVPGKDYCDLKFIITKRAVEVLCSLLKFEAPGSGIRPEDMKER